MKIANVVTIPTIYARAAGVNPVSQNRPGSVAYGVPGRPGGVRVHPLAAPYVPGGGTRMRLGNLPQALSDYINSPGTPGSSNSYMYGLGQPDVFDTSYSPATVASQSSADVSPSTSPSFWDALTNIAKTAASVAPAVLQTITAANAQQALQQGKITAAQYQQLVQNPTATIALQPSAGLATGLKVSGATLAVLGAAALFLLMRKRR